MSQQQFTTLGSVAVAGGTIYMVSTNPPPNLGIPAAISAVFVPTSVSGSARNLPLTAAKSDAGVALTATAAAGAMGVSRTAGTSLQLVGEQTSSNAKTDKALWEFSLPDSYVAGANIAVNVNASVSGGGTLTGASTTMTVAAYTESVAGVEAALVVSAAQQIVAAGSTLQFTITGTGLVPGQRVVVELVMLVTSASGNNTGAVNSVSYVA